MTVANPGEMVLAEGVTTTTPLDALATATGLETPTRSAGRLRPLLALAPYVAHYRGRALLALVALIVAALTTLVVPIAIRRII
jgi:ATP-binding cassette subfamily B protein